MPSLCHILSLALLTSTLLAEERRAPPPTFSPQQLRGVFFDKLDDAFRGTRPTLSGVRKSAPVPLPAVAPTGTAAAAPAAGDSWSPLISPASIEDEIKRVRLHYDALVTTPGDFNSGGYQAARLDLTVLATLFAVINEHGGEVRWKDQAAAARDLIARTAFNCKAGSTQVYNEAKLRKADLQDLISGSGLANREAEAENDWTKIADRSPLMAYAEALVESLADATRDPGAIQRDIDLIKRNAELLAMLGEVLVQEGMDEAADADYVKLSRDMTAAGKALTEAVARADAAAIGQATGAIRQRCDACHEQYR
jgi:hypothetical protein